MLLWLGTHLYFLHFILNQIPLLLLSFVQSEKNNSWKKQECNQRRLLSMGRRALGWVSGVRWTFGFESARIREKLCSGKDTLGVDGTTAGDISDSADGLALFKDEHAKGKSDAGRPGPCALVWV